VELVDYKVRILAGSAGTDSITRVLVSSARGAREWTTVGVHANVVEASWQALVDALVYALRPADVDFLVPELPVAEGAVPAHV
jgi:2-isopropylmalate synthase